MFKSKGVCGLHLEMCKRSWEVIAKRKSTQCPTLRMFAGDILGPALSNLDSLVRMPTGCGEQNMVGFTPNIYVLQYLTATSRLTEAIQDKATHHMEIGKLQPNSSVCRDSWSAVLTFV